MVVFVNACNLFSVCYPWLYRFKSILSPAFAVRKLNERSVPHFAYESCCGRSRKSKHLHDIRTTEAVFRSIALIENQNILSRLLAQSNFANFSFESLFYRWKTCFRLIDGLFALITACLLYRYAIIQVEERYQKVRPIRIELRLQLRAERAPAARRYLPVPGTWLTQIPSTCIHHPYSKSDSEYLHSQSPGLK